MYGWLVFLHLAGLVLFVLCHGVSAFVAYRLRTVRDPGLAIALLDLSLRANRVAYVGLIALVVGGLGAAATNNLLGTTWVVATGVVLVAVLVLMFAIAGSYYYPVRDRLMPKPTDTRPPIGEAELTTLLDSRRPDLLGAVGAIGLLVMIGLMVLKPA